MTNKKISALTAATTPLAGTEVLPIVQSSVTTQVSVANLTAGRFVSASSMAVNSASASGNTLLVNGNIQASSTIRTDTGSGTTTSFLGTGGNSNFQVNHTSGSSVLNIVNSASTYPQITFSGSSTAFSLLSSGDIKANVGNLIQGTAAKGINFTANTPAAGMTSQLLNWYEEGTWTPTFTGWAIAPTLFYAQYTRIGRQVTVNIYAQGGTSSYTAIGGLPFTANAAQGSAGVINSSNAAVLYGCSIVPSGSTIQGINMVMGANYWQLTITYFV